MCSVCKFAKLIPKRTEVNQRLNILIVLPQTPLQQSALLSLFLRRLLLQRRALLPPLQLLDHLPQLTALQLAFHLYLLTLILQKCVLHRQHLEHVVLRLNDRLHHQLRLQQPFLLDQFLVLLAKSEALS